MARLRPVPLIPPTPPPGTQCLSVISCQHPPSQFEWRSRRPLQRRVEGLGRLGRGVGRASRGPAPTPARGAAPLKGFARDSLALAGVVFARAALLLNVALPRVLSLCLLFLPFEPFATMAALFQLLDDTYVLLLVN